MKRDGTANHRSVDSTYAKLGAAIHLRSSTSPIPTSATRPSASRTASPILRSLYFTLDATSLASLSSRCFPGRGLRPQWRCAVSSNHTRVIQHTANKLFQTAKPSTALLPFRAGQCAMISSTASKPAAPQQTPGIVAGNDSTIPPMKERREVPLPSQEGKKGAMQFALYDIYCYDRVLTMSADSAIVGQRSTKWQTGLVSRLSGP